MKDTEFQERTEKLADVAQHLADELWRFSRDPSFVDEAKRYLSLARTAAQESELWVGKAMVAFAESQRLR